MSRLGDIFNLVGGGTPTTSIEEYWGNGTPWISSADIDHSGRIVYRRRVTPSGVANSTTSVVPRGTVIVVTRVGLGKVAQLTEDTCFSQDIQALLAKETAPAYSSRFLMYQLLFKMQTVKYSGRGTTISGITKKQLADVSLYFPPLPEQERIVARIEELFSQLDAGVETLKKTKAQLAVYRQAVLKEAFEGKYTPDVTMHEIKMGEIADGKDGLRRGPFGSAIKKAFFVESGYKVYEQGNAINNDCKRGHYYISADKYNELSSFQLRPGDFIVSCSGTIGKIAQLPADAEPGVINQALMRIRLKPDVIDPYYFMMQFRSEVFQRKIVSRGSGMGNLAGIKEFKLATMFIPENYENQKQIVAEIESRMSVCDSIEQTVDTALQQAEAMRQGILKQAFGGAL